MSLAHGGHYTKQPLALTPGAGGPPLEPFPTPFADSGRATQSQAFVFEAISTTTLTLLRTRVEDALVRWEPRISVERVSALPSVWRTPLMTAVNIHSLQLL
jgi:hypothetical protein